jgi:S1-C subfamily serine protease
LRLWGHWWFKALVAGVILIGLVLGMKSGKSANGSPPLSSEQSIAAASGNSSASSSTPVGGTVASRSDAKPLSAPAGARSAEDVFGQVSVSVVRINVFNAAGAPVSTGSGVVIGPGTVITNCHVALGGETLEVKLGGAAYSATVEIADEERDLCRLGVNGLTAPAVSIGSVDSLRVGQRVFAIGAPQGLDLTISDGIVSALREVRGGKMIQTSAPVSPGSSGGGLFDASARLVGIVTFQNRVGQNLNFAVPADWVSEIRNR